MWNYIFLSIFVIFKSIYLAKSADPTTQPPCWTSLPVDKSNLNASNCFIRDCKQDEQCICDTKTGLCHQYCTANFCPLIKCNAPMGCDQHTNNHFNKIKVLEATSKIVQQVRCFFLFFLAK